MFALPLTVFLFGVFFRFLHNDKKTYFRGCLTTLGCMGFNFREKFQANGDCALIAPAENDVLTDIPGADSPNWNYWAVEN